MRVESSIAAIKIERVVPFPSNESRQSHIRFESMIYVAELP